LRRSKKHIAVVSGRVGKVLLDIGYEITVKIISWRIGNRRIEAIGTFPRIGNAIAVCIEGAQRQLEDPALAGVGVRAVT
jgi:hypothetical protein